MILLNPGPVNLTTTVRAALTRPDLCHREAEFADLQDEIRRGLLDIYGLAPQTWAAVLLAGSGTAAVEAMLTSLLPHDGKLLIAENGVYGERFTTLARIHGIAHRHVTFPWGDKLDPTVIEHALKAESGMTHLAVVHHETTTGRLNDLAELGVLCAAHGVELLVDAVSSFGAEEVDFTRWNIAAAAATANKCLHGVPGLSLVIARRSALFADIPKRTLYFDLANHCRAQDRRSVVFTPPVQLCYALAQAVTELREQGGWRARGQQYRSLARSVRNGLLALGIQPLLAEHESSVALTAYHLPENIDYDTWHDELKACGFVIYAAQGYLAQRLFRISIMGEVTPYDIARLLLACRKIITAHTAPATRSNPLDAGLLDDAHNDPVSTTMKN